MDKKIQGQFEDDEVCFSSEDSIFLNELCG